jgi:hypothetical protein
MDSEAIHYVEGAPMSTYQIQTGLRRAWRTDKPLTFVGLAMGVVLVIAAFGLVLDHQVITGAPAWLKPAKFAISIAIYSFTFLWLLTFVAGHRRLVRAVSWVTAGAFVVEMAIIAVAAGLGTTSHFNVSTPLHTAIWSVMAAAIVLAAVASLVVGVLLLRQRMPDAAFGWSLRFGVLVSFVGMGVAFFMTSPTAQQLAAAHSTGSLPVAGAHSVGVPDGGPGLPVLGWSTVGGDLRAPHFIGLHALQVLPLLGFLLARFGPAWLRPADRVALIWTAGLGYLGVVALTTWQALRAQSLVHPDGLTLAALAALIVAVITSTVFVAVRARSATVAAHA